MDLTPSGVVVAQAGRGREGFGCSLAGQGLPGVALFCGLLGGGLLAGQGRVGPGSGGRVELCRRDEKGEGFGAEISLGAGKTRQNNNADQNMGGGMLHHKAPRQAAHEKNYSCCRGARMEHIRLKGERGRERMEAADKSWP